MAAAFAEALGEATVRVRSAGRTPADRVHPVVVQAMREVGIDLSENRPSALREDAVREVDVVVTMGCGDACPIYPGKRYEDWPVEDPAGKPLEVVRAIRDEIGGRVEQLIREVA